jgi:hypothetical protein
MAPSIETSNWQFLAEQASKETDGKKLSALIDQLCRALDGTTPKATPLITPPLFASA